MKESTTFRTFAKYYDLLYKDKNYAKETDFLEACFQEYLRPKKILEIGCGTGNYTRIFYERGYEITGIDASEQMLNIARSKCMCNFQKMDVRDFSLPEKYDCCLGLFAVMGYVTDNSAIQKALRKIRNHLVEGGLFIFDVWNGLAVMRNLPESRAKEVEDETVKIVRFCTPALNPFEHTCEVNYKLLIEEKVSHTNTQIEEKHVVRFYFPQEIKYFLESNGFSVLKICPFMELNGAVNENTWNMTVISKAV